MPVELQKRAQQVSKNSTNNKENDSKMTHKYSRKSREGDSKITVLATTFLLDYDPGAIRLIPG